MTYWDDRAKEIIDEETLSDAEMSKEITDQIFNATVANW